MPPAPVSAPPQSFAFPDNNPVSNSTTISNVSLTGETLLGFFSAPQLPEGFEMAKPISPFSLFKSQLATFLGFGVKKTETVSTAVPAPLPSGSVSFDFDSDGKADISRWRASTGEWTVKTSSDNSTTNYNLGSGSDLIVPADYDDDSRTDYAVFSPAMGVWTIHGSKGVNFTVEHLGQPGDKPVVGDYDGDAKADPAVWKPSDGTWYIAESTNSYTVASYQFGQSGDIPVPGDYDGDGALDKAVFRPTGGYWYVLGTSSGLTSAQWGLSSDIPVQADYDGDNKTDYCVYRGSTGTWYAHKSSAPGQYLAQIWGNYGDQPVAADYDADGLADFAVWRPTSGNWHIYKSCNYAAICADNNNYEYAQLGMNGDLPAPAAYLKQIGNSVQGSDLAKARLSPQNAIGGADFYSRNFNWNTSLVSLPGRAGLNAEIGISYNSLVWTKQGSNIYFDVDNSNLSPGFRFGFPVIEPIYYNDTDSRTFNYLMVSSSGARVEFRQVNGASDTYETADSSYSQLKTYGATNPNAPVDGITIVVTGTDGTKMSFEWKAGAFRCSQIKDRNGNFITIEHDELGLLRTVVDTLGRILTVNYDNQLSPTSITQTWKNDNGKGAGVTHTWATFTYSTSETPINTNFNPGVITNVFGPPNGAILKLLKKITYPDGTSTSFSHNAYGQVWKVENLPANSSVPLNQVRTDLENPSANQSDCPRFSQTRTKIENFNNNQEIVVNNEILPNQSYNVGGHSGLATLIRVWMENHPDGAVSKTFVGASGWQEAISLATEDWVTENGSPVRKRWSWKNWTQDNPNLNYILNPRLVESKTGDAANIRKISVEYYRVSAGSPVALYGLVKKAQLHDGVSGTLLKEVTNEYNTDAAYLSRRIIGLPSKTEVSGLNQENNTFELVSKVTYAYDGDALNNPDYEQNIADAIQHDNTNYGSGFVTGRGNLTGTTRHDVTGQTAAVTSNVKFNTTGAKVAQIDPLGKILKIGYADNFNDGVNNRKTYAYATSLTDPANNVSNILYRFDIGAKVWAKSPDPNSATAGKVTARTFDSIGRLQKVSVFKGNQAYLNNQEYTYTRYEYPANKVQSLIYTPLIDADGDGQLAEDEVLSEVWTDGAGRVLKSRTEHPGSSGGYTGTLSEYNILGQLKRSSVPTEIDSNWTPAGDDQSRSWLWTSREYDWKGRITRIIPSDSNGADGKDRLFSYEGCACGGGEIVTVDGELVPVPGQSQSARRRQKIYSDSLGRQYKTEIMKWDGASVYTTTVNTFNGRDQIVRTRQYAETANSQGTTGSPLYQDMTMTYDGHGRMKTRHYPIEDAQTETSWIYNADDSVQQIVDPRGAITNFSYDNRGLVSQISYAPPANNPPPNSPAYMNIPDTPTVEFTYDAVGNRTKMDDGLGEVTYQYNELSQLTAEIRKFDDNLADAPSDAGSNQVFKIEYGYNRGGGLSFIKDPYGAQINYIHDKTARLTAVRGTTFGTGSNATTEYVEDIQYRAFGNVKLMTYQTDDNAQVSVQYDNLLRVRQHQVTTNTAENGYLKKAAFSYLNDSRPQFMDNEVDSGFDRSFQYDHLGRLTNNQIGNQTPLPYTQTVQYDAFSQITNRSMIHWFNSDQYTSTFSNGREAINGVSGTKYDLAGNQVDSGSRGDNLYHTTQFDAANRRVVFSSRRKVPRGRSSYDIVTDSFTQYHDGDGNPLKMTRRLDSQNQPTATKYQIRSSVLGSTLTEVNYTGRKEMTKVFADGAVIAEQVRTLSSNNSNIDKVEWLHADPVTGSSTRVHKDGTIFYRTEYEQLGGQEVYPFEPEEEFPAALRFSQEMLNADGVLWQCALGEETGGSIMLPTRCGLAARENLDLSSSPSPKAKGNPNNIGKEVGSNRGSAQNGSMPADPIPTQKPPAEAGPNVGVIPMASIPNDGKKPPTLKPRRERPKDLPDINPDTEEAEGYETENLTRISILGSRFSRTESAEYAGVTGVGNAGSNANSANTDCSTNLLVLFFLRDTKNYTKPNDQANLNYIHIDAAEAFRNAITEAEAAGIKLVFSDVFRDGDMQGARKKAHLKGTGAPAASVGSSAHEAGMGFDVHILNDDEKSSQYPNQTLVNIFKKHGFIRTIPKKEQWHFVWKGFSADKIAAAQAYAQKCKLVQ